MSTITTKQIETITKKLIKKIDLIDTYKIKLNESINKHFTQEPATKENTNNQSIILVDSMEKHTTEKTENEQIINMIDDVFNNFIKIKLRLNNKIPIDEGWQKSKSKKQPDKQKYNTGIITGVKNNLFVVDVDAKDEGVEEFNNYISEFGDPGTLRIATPSGGYHYYFLYESGDKQIDYIIETYFKNNTKKRGKGLDIRTTGGQVVAPGSCINDKYYKIDNYAPIQKIPMTLIDWLIDPLYNPIKTKKTTTTKIKDIKNDDNELINLFDDYEYYINDDTLDIILDKLNNNDHLNNYSNWLKVLTCFKSLNKFDMFDKWSKGGIKYNYDKNLKHWNNNPASIDINYLVFYLNRIDETCNLEIVEKSKKIKNDVTNDNKCQNIEINNKYVFNENDQETTFNYNHFKNNDTIIIKSCTGTGKTTATAKHIKTYIEEHDRTKILCITNKVTLTDQIYKSFTDAGVKMFHYNDNEAEYDQNIAICINSILKLQTQGDDINDYIIYIDEINSFLKLTHNETLDHRMKDIFFNLLDLIKNCKKLILSDNIINDNVFTFIKSRPCKTIYINNVYNKYQDVKAYKIRDEQAFENKILDHVRNNKFFLFGCDSCETVTGIYYKCYDIATPEQRDNMILITANTKFKIRDASTQFKNKFVFYSPSMTTGVDFSIDVKQDAFIYNKGGSIDPAEVFQQTTRTRNIDNLYYYSEIKQDKAKYNDLEDTEQTILNELQLNKNFNDYCFYHDETNQKKICKNSFYGLYIYNTYLLDIYATNKTKHYEKILKNAGFKIHIVGTKNTPKTKEAKQEIKNMIDNINNKLFDEYLEADETERANNNKFDQLTININYLGLAEQDKEILIQYKTIIIDKFKIIEHDNLIKLLRNDKFIKDKIIKHNETNYDIKIINDTFNKINIMRTFEKKHNISTFDVTFKTDDNKIEFNDNEYNLIKKVFRISAIKPENTKDLKKIYITMIKNISFVDVITTDRNTKKNNKDRVYELNTQVIKDHLILHTYKTKNYISFHENIKNQFKDILIIDDLLDLEQPTQRKPIIENKIILCNCNKSIYELCTANKKYFCKGCNHWTDKTIDDDIIIEQEPPKQHNETKPKNKDNKLELTTNDEIITAVKNFKLCF